MRNATAFHETGNLYTVVWLELHVFRIELVGFIIATIHEYVFLVGGGMVFVADRPY